MLGFYLVFKINFQDGCQQSYLAFRFYYSSENYTFT